MKIVATLAPASPRARLAVVGLAMVAGVASTVALVIINQIARAPELATLPAFFVFAAAVVISLIAARRNSRLVIGAVEGTLHELKAHLGRKIQGAALQRFQQIGQAEIFDRVSQNLAVISLAGSQIGAIIQAICIFLLALAYLAWLSPSIFVVLIIPLAAGLFTVIVQQRQVVARIDALMAARLHFLDRIMDLIRGAKEIKLNRARARGVRQHFEGSSAELRDLAAEVSRIWADSQLFLNLVLFVLLALLVFVVPQYAVIEVELLGQVVIVLLFAWGSLQSAVIGYSMVIAAEQSLLKLEALGRKLDGEAPMDPEDLAHSHGVDEVDGVDEVGELDELRRWVGATTPIELRAIEYSYPARGDGDDSEEGFTLGPIDLRIEPGELLFIVGGNGAGKSTLLSVLTGLYAPTAGTLHVGGVTLGPHNLAAYREQLSVIFTDVHLFSRAYGLLDADPERVAELLRELAIEDKTRFVGGRFSNLRLSSGQRKRLAMVIALLEQRPILVLDEWAADQDPEFREHFYTHMLPALRRAGKTVIAVSHDDRYFHCADRVVVLDYGKLREIEVHRHPPAPAPA